MEPREWSRAEVQDFARGRLLTLFAPNGEPRPVPPWLREVMAGISPYDQGNSLALAHPHDHRIMLERFVECSKHPGSMHETRARFKIDDAWWWMSVRVLNLLEMDGVRAMLSATTYEGRMEHDAPEPTDLQTGDHDSMSWMQVRLDYLGIVLRVEGKSVEIAGRTPEEMVGQALTTFIHPDSSGDSVPMWFSLLTEGPGATRSSRRCYVHPDGSELWVESAYLNRLEGDGGGDVLMFAYDITERRAEEEVLRQRTDEVALLAAESRLLAEDFRLLADEVPAAVFRCDDRGRVLFHNARWTELLGEDHELTRLDETVHPDDRDQLRTSLAEVVAAGLPTPHSFELRSAWGGRTFAFRCRSITGPDPAPCRIVGSIEDVTATVQLRLDASHDALTGLLNRAAIDVALERALRTDPGTVLVLFLDLDGFKEVNDAYGHDAGDTVLREVAARLAAALRPEDVVGRYGGDEFVVVCRSVQAAGTAALRHRLEQALDGPVHFPGGSWRAAASIGTARPEPDDDLASVLKRADQAMFEEKRNRRRTPSSTA